MAAAPLSLRRAGSFALFELSLSVDEVVAGRWAARAALWLDDLGVPCKASRVHAKLQRHGVCWFLTDSGSANGTYHNGRRLATGERVSLAIGDAVSFGTPFTTTDGTASLMTGYGMPLFHFEVVETPVPGPAELVMSNAELVHFILGFAGCDVLAASAVVSLVWGAQGRRAWVERYGELRAFGLTDGQLRRKICLAFHPCAGGGRVAVRRWHERHELHVGGVGRDASNASRVVSDEAWNEVVCELSLGGGLDNGLLVTLAELTSLVTPGTMEVVRLHAAHRLVEQDDALWSTFASAVASSTLRTLEVRGARVGDRTARALAAAMRDGRLRQLADLSLCSTDISPKGAQAIIDALPHCAQLRGRVIELGSLALYHWAVDHFGSARPQLELPSPGGRSGAHGGGRFTLNFRANFTDRSCPLPPELAGAPSSDGSIATAPRAAADPREWLCSACTYAHRGPRNFSFLACEMCGQPRYHQSSM